MTELNYNVLTSNLLQTQTSPTYTIQTSPLLTDGYIVHWVGRFDTFREAAEAILKLL